MTAPKRLRGVGGELEGQVVRLLTGERAVVLSHRGEYDDDCTLRYVDGPCAGQLMEADTFVIRRCLREGAL